MSKKFLAALAVAGFVTSAMAIITFDADSGTGFVGKGDVQLVYGWSNKGAQDNATKVQFRALTTTVSEVSWECTNSSNQKVQERERTTTKSTRQLVSTVARQNGNQSQYTGFNLEGYKGVAEELSSETEGPKLSSCPATPGGWTLTSPPGDPVVLSSSAQLQVTIAAPVGWQDIPTAP